MQYFLIFVGSGIGGLLRFVVYKMQALLGFVFPVATLVCNFVGSIVIILVLYYVKEGNVKLFWSVGFLGGFTTYSTFVLDVVKTPYVVLYGLLNIVIIFYLLCVC